MLMVDVEAVGPVALNRMARDGIVVSTTDQFALPRDIEATVGIRALSISHLVPGHTVLSALTGIWVWTGGQWPGAVRVVGARGLHRVTGKVGGAEPGPGVVHGNHDVRFHSGVAWREDAQRVGAVRIAGLARCGVDALRWDDHRRAIPVVAGLVAKGAVTVADLLRERRLDSPQGAGYSRMANAWSALYPTLEVVQKRLTPPQGTG